MHINRITDLSAPELQDYERLTDVALRRVSEPAGGLYIAESAKVIARALAAGHRPRSVLLLEQWLPEVSALLEQYDVPVFIGTAELLETLTGFEMHRGALASMHRPVLPDPAELLKNARRVVVIEDVDGALELLGCHVGERGNGHGRHRHERAFLSLLL